MSIKKFLFIFFLASALYFEMLVLGIIAINTSDSLFVEIPGIGTEIYLYKFAFLSIPVGGPLVPLYKFAFLLYVYVIIVLTSILYGISKYKEWWEYIK